MQKVFRRTVLAEKQAARKATKIREKNMKIWLRSNKDQRAAVNSMESQVNKNAVRFAKEDWELGPLKPRRDVGDWKEKYGAMDQHLFKAQTIYRPDLYEKLKIHGGFRLNIKVGDRVVLLSGHDKGKIGLLKEIDKSRAQCTVEGLNLTEVAISKYMIKPEDPDQRPIRTMERPINIDQVRLVHRMTTDGVPKDVIIKELVKRNIRKASHGTVSWTRGVMIDGEFKAIGWPKKEAPREKEDTPADTLRIDVEAKTFIPTLLLPPMPRTVIDELRNKYSVFRTRHEPEYIAAKEAEEQEKVEKKKMAKLMRTPLQEIHRKQRKLRKMKGKGKLTPEMLERIGKVIAEKRQLIEGAEEEPVLA